MKDFLAKNKISIAIIIAAFIIAGSIWLSNIAASTTLRRTPTLQQPAKRISYTEAPNHVGEYVCVAGKVDNVRTPKETTFLNFCPNYRTCPFGAVIFRSDAFKFPNPKQYEGKTVEITGLITTHQGRPEIVLNDPNQIKISSREKAPTPQQPKPPEPAQRPPNRVVEVIDGDTIRVNLGGKIETVRLIGINTPEIASPYNPKEDCFGQEAAQYTRELLEKQLVYLIKDPMQSNRDKYNRLLRYVFLEDGTLINAKLIKEGYAFNYIYEPFQFMKQFDYLEKQAKENRIGLWSDKCNYYFDSTQK